MNEVRGYSLFNEVEDKVVQTYNRARILKNIMTDYSDADRNVSQTGEALIYKYFEGIPVDDRRDVHTKLKELLITKDTV